MTVHPELTTGWAPGLREASSSGAGSPVQPHTAQPRPGQLADPPGEVWSARLEACFRAHSTRVLAYCVRRLGDRSAAEDVTAETFLVAWRRLDLMPADELPWLLGIARHAILNERRSGRRRQRLLARVAAQPVADATEPGPPSSAPTAVHAALAQLSERDREVLMLTTWDGLDQRRAAAVLGCSEGAFKVRLHRARKRLARTLDSTPSTRGKDS